MKKSLLSLVGLFWSAHCFAGQVETYSAIAEELFDDRKFAQAIEKCSKVLSERPDHAGCKSIVEKSQHELASMKANKQKQEELAELSRKEALKKKQASESEEKEKERIAESNRQKTLNSPEYNARKACACKSAESFLQSKVAEEQKVGAIGGFVNKDKLHRLSSQIILTEKAGHYYQSKAGSSFNAAQCSNSMKGWELFGACVNDTPNEVFQ